jgi:hypothetical protein
MNSCLVKLSTLKELHFIAKFMTKGKSPSLDGVAIEIYMYYFGTT